MRKSNAAIKRCKTMSTLQKILGGKWKLEIEADGFLHRHDFHEVPPHVEYTLTELGESFLSVLHYMKAWGEKNL